VSKAKIRFCLAYYLWQNKEQVLPIDDLNDWYQHWLHQDADLYAQYKNISID
jgi:hypothetical protein